ncbi:antibiotic biosynthesis monooxygenase [Pseudomonas sp. KHPS1]|nr:antibiotic biosynthesis monooxygenase [Pseudomonas sp. KHPS1]ATH80040.1 antibiotic biosynthesis monooxygenase [Pseudomonas mendocina]UTH36387.1 antibiotic biosynthesis monooxygenase [Pseudomonas sp. KHPS1]
MTPFADTPEPPYYAVIFTSTLGDDSEGYAAMASRMVKLAAEQPGFLGAESAREGLGITVSYWRDLDAIAAWKANAEHREAQRLGRARWYSGFRLRIARVERDYGLD